VDNDAGDASCAARPGRRFGDHRPLRAGRGRDEPG